MDTFKSNQNIQKPMEVFINGVSGLRALGIFGVIFYHMFPYTIKGGFLGVTLFFMISGYLLAVKSEEQRRVTKFSAPGFYLKRLKRLYPQLLIVIFVTCGVLKYLLPGQLKGIKAEILSIIFGYNNIWQISQNASYFDRIANSSPFTHMWSLSNEIQLYLIWPLIFMIFLHLIKVFDTNKAISIMGAIAIITSFIMPIMYMVLMKDPNADVTRIYYGTDTRIFSCITGAYIGFTRTRYKRRLRIKEPKPYCIGYGVLTAVILVSYLFMAGDAAITYLGGMFAINIVFAAMLLFTTDTRLPIGKFLEKKVFTFFGDVSYEMYLWMYPVIFIFHSMSWHRIPLSPIIMMVIIVALAKWLNSFVRFLIKFKIDLNGNVKEKTRKLAFLACSFALMIVTVIGASAAVMAEPKDTESRTQMEAEFAANAQKLEEQKQEQLSQSESKIEEEKTDTKSETEDEPSTETTSEETVYVPQKITAIGDSVMLGAAMALQDAIPGIYVDAKESRQAYNTIDVIRELESMGQLGDTIVLGVGTNGPFSESDGQKIVDYLGPDRHIFWVNVFANSVAWVDVSNNVIKTLCEKNDNVILVDWASEGPKHPDWFYDDGIHLRPPEGQEGYAEFVNKSVYE